MTLKTGFVQCDTIRYDSVCLTCSKKLTGTQLSLPHTSLKVTENGTIRKLRYGFLFAFHSNYGSILYHFGDNASSGQKSRAFSYPFAFDTPYREEGCPSKYCRTVWYEKKTRMAGLPLGEKSLMIYLAVSIEYRRVTTSRDRPLLRCRPGGWTETVRRDWSTKMMAGRTVLSLKIIFYHDNL